MPSNVRHQVIIDGRPDPELTAALSELEVLESVRNESRFRLRLEANVEGGDFRFLNDSRLVPGVDREVTLVALVDTTPEVLVHGVIQSREVQLRHGGQGSFIDVLGVDRRALMDRNYSDYGAHSGTVPVIVMGLFAKYGFVPDVEFVESDVYTPLTKSLNQTGSDLQLVRRLAAQHAVEFWLDWKLLPGGRVVETAHFRSQPPRSPGGALGGALGGAASAAASLLGVGGGPEFKMNTGDGTNNILSFRSCRRSDVPNASGSVSRVDIDSGRIERTRVTGPSQAPLGKAVQNATIERSVVSAGGASEANRRTQAALNDAAWSIEAAVDTTAHAFGALVRPRQVVKVRGTGQIDDGEYFVWSVQHRANEASHKMTVELRRNATGGGP